MAEHELSQLQKLLSVTEIVTQDSQEYKEASKTWAIQENKRPKLVVIPKNLEKLREVVAFLGASSLKFAVRCTGVGSASTEGVLVFLQHFKSFSFDAGSETISFGAGHDWGEIDEKVEKEAPGYASVSARCTYVGVGGSILHGGQSWLSSEHGLSSDPQNMLDAQVVKSKSFLFRYLQDWHGWAP
jgi:FAD/FMN-containing dehydrogenase